MKLGCHAVLFAERISAETESVLAGLAKSGCAGVEIGVRFFGVDKGRELKKALDKYGLALSGLHVPFVWTDLLDRPRTVRESFEKAAAFLQVMPERNIITTGVPAVRMDDYAVQGPDIRLTRDETLDEMALCLDRIAMDLGEKGVAVHYHNHSWEFERDGQIYDAVMRAAPHVRFGLDTGWAAVSGFDPVSLMEKAPHRFSYVHLRDYRKELAGTGTDFMAKKEAFVDVGTGDMDFSRLLAALNRVLGDTGWAVIEYETGEVSFERYKAAADYLRGCGF